MQYTPEGRTIIVTGQREDEQPTLYLVNTGIPQKEVSIIFNKYETGTRLGFALFKFLIVLHDRAIHAKTMIDGGVTMECHLPCSANPPVGNHVLEKILA